MTALNKVEKKWSELAQALLLPYRNRDVHKSVSISGERADELVMRITEALVMAYQDGEAEAERFIA